VGYPERESGSYTFWCYLSITTYMANIKLLIADDHGLVRQSLRQYLEMEGDIEVVGEASGGDEVLDLLNDSSTIHPDVVVLDTRMPEKDGLETARQIRDTHSDVGVVMLSAYDDPQFVTEALRAGARAYVLKNKDVEYLIETVRLVAEGRIVIDPELAPAIAEGLSTGKGGHRKSDTLTAREMEVLQLLAFGHTNKDIAERLGISAETVKAHLEHVFEKLEVSDRAAAVATAFRRGLIE
jgi:two-component system, NarL family, response regulator DegU